jgi:hypothetical protein
MLHACILTDGPKWGKHLPLAEFSCNNSYQESIKMSPFEALYGRPCYTPLSWSESGERVIFGPDIVTEAEREGKANPSKHFSRLVLSKELCQQETQSLGV